MEQVSAMAPPPHEDRTPYEGGSGRGKLKAKRGVLSVKRTGTPYERPVVGRHASAGPQSALSKGDASAGLAQRGSWLGAGIVDSASRILTRSAAFLYSSLFKRQVPAITAAPTVTGETERAFRQSETPSEDVPPLEVVQLSSEMNVSNLHEEEENMNAGSWAKASDNDTLTMPVNAGDVHLENLLKQRELTREQCERYIKLIESRVVADRDVGTSPSNILSHPETHRWRDEREKVRNKGLRSGCGDSKEDRENRGSSPIDLAKSHMYAYSFQSPVRSDQLTSGASRTPGRPIGHGSSAIPPREPRIEHQSGEFISRWTPIQVPISGGRELLKRRASVLDDRCPLPGAARRTKDKSSTAALELRALSNANHKGSLDSEANLDLSCFRNEKKKSLSGMEMSIPRQSTRTARKILDTLERRRPLFKEQHSGKEFALVCQGSKELEQFPRETTSKDIKVRDGLIRNLKNTSAEGFGLQKSSAEGILAANGKSFLDTVNEDYDELKTNAALGQNVKCDKNTDITSSRSSRKGSANSVIAPVSLSSFATSGFTFPSSGSGPEPPTPKPMPSSSPVTESTGVEKVKLELSRENLFESRNKQLPTTAAWKNTALSSLDKLPLSSAGRSSGADVPSRNAVLGADGYDMQNLVARADKASSMLATTYGATSASFQADFGDGSFIASPTFSDSTANHLSFPSSNYTTTQGSLKFGSANGFRPATDASGTGSVADKGPFSSPSVNPFGAFSAVTPAFSGFLERRDAFLDSSTPASADEASELTTQVTAAATQEPAHASSSTPSFTAAMFEASQMQYSVGAQSLAPPDANNPLTQSSGLANGGFSLGVGVGIDKGSTRRKKSAGLKRMK